MTCPECGAPIVGRPRDVAWFLHTPAMFVLSVWILDTGFAQIYRFGETNSLLPALLAAGSITAVLVVFRACGGERFRRHGFRLCPACGWLACGDESGALLRAAREQARIRLGRMARLLPLPFLFFGALSALSRPLPLRHWLLWLAFGSTSLWVPLVHRAPFVPRRGWPREDRPASGAARDSPSGATSAR